MVQNHWHNAEKKGVIVLIKPHVKVLPLRGSGPWVINFFCFIVFFYTYVYLQAVYQLSVPVCKSTYKLGYVKRDSTAFKSKMTGCGVRAQRGRY